MIDCVSRERRRLLKLGLEQVAKTGRSALATILARMNGERMSDETYTAALLVLRRYHRPLPPLRVRQMPNGSVAFCMHVQLGSAEQLTAAREQLAAARAAAPYVHRKLIATRR